MSKKNKWKRLRPDGNEYLEDLLRKEKMLTAYWYQRISGAVPWKPGERETLNAEMDALSMQVDHAIGRTELSACTHHKTISNITNREV